MAAAGLALAVNALIAWQLPAVLVPPRRGADVAAPPLQVVWIAAPRRPAAAAIAPLRQPHAPAHVAPASGPIREAPASPAPAAQDATPIPLARPMVAVYLQQAGRWAQDHPVPAAPTDPFARRPGALADQPASRFRLKRPLSVADAVAMVGVAFANPPHPCIRNPDDVAGYATGGDALALQMALDVERHCRP